MKFSSAIRRLWIPGILVLGLAFWLWPQVRPDAPPPGLTRDEANRQAAPALREIRRHLAPPPAPPAAGEPAIRLRAETIRPGMDFGSTVHARPSARGYP